MKIPMCKAAKPSVITMRSATERKKEPLKIEITGIGQN